MKFYNEVYGADADNNRGVASISYEIETSDNDEIIDKLYDLFLDGTTTGEHNIFMYCYLIDDDIEIVVNIENYIDGLIEKAKEDEGIKDDEELQEWLNQIIKETQKYIKIKKIAEKHNLFFCLIDIDVDFAGKAKLPIYRVRNKIEYGFRGEYYKYIILDADFKIFATGDEQGNYAGGINSEFYPKVIDKDYDEFKLFIKELNNEQ